MAGTMAADTPAQAKDLVEDKLGLIRAVCGTNRENLKKTLDNCGLKQAGNKADQQIRVIDCITTPLLSLLLPQPNLPYRQIL